ncbi:hypothetical protein OQA88_8791 [Cercophora sp. LCS_1]
MPASLVNFPDEIIRHILEFVSPEDNLRSIQLVSRQLHHVANDALLWKYYCSHSFLYWDPKHQFHRKLLQRASSVKWKDLWLTRERHNGRIADWFEGILQTKVGQLTRLRSICLLGYDSKDYLLDQYQCADDADDVLARRYYAMSALDSIHRGIAVDVWSKYQGSPLTGRGLEEALGAFDMFVLHDAPHDLNYITRELDGLTTQFRTEHPALEQWSTRQKALHLVRWLRLNNLTGMDEPETNYRNLRNCLIGHALSDPSHPSLPIISSAIFCCVADRLGMLSACCAFPSHVHASVFAPAGFTLDGVELPDPSDPPESMYLDPYGSSEEVTLADLRERLVEFGWNLGAEAFLKATPVTIIVQRTAQNIKGAYSTIRSLERSYTRETEMKRLRRGHPDLNLEAASYSAMWAELMVKQTSSAHWDANLDAFLNRFALSWSEDAWIVEKYLVPLYDRFTASQPQRQRRGWENVRAILNMLSNLDNRQPTVSRRYTQEIQERVKYKIGQVFRHKRYQYVGVINGWATNGTTALPMPHYLATEEAQQDGAGTEEEGVTDNARQGPGKTYYTCLKHAVDRLRVDQDNMEIIKDPSLIPASLFHLAGKFFKTFDAGTCTFVSNIREYYPDD